MFFLATGIRLAVRMNAGLAVTSRLQPLFTLVQKNRHVTSRAVLTAGALVAVVAVPVTLFPLASPWPAWLSLAVALFNVVHALLAMREQEKERSAMDKMLEDAPR